jgi:GT2 family glycosyltransferase
MADPLISVLVPVHDPGDMLAPLARRILDEQTYPHEQIQLVIVDDSSSDGSVEALQAERAGDARLVVKRAEFRQIDASRNYARASADGELLAMTDHDCTPATDWLERAAARSKPDEVLIGHIRFTASEHPSVWELLDISNHLDQKRYVEQGAGTTANLFIWADAFDRLGGLNETLQDGGDFEFTGRANNNGIPLIYAKDVVIAHPTRATREQYLKKLRRIGHSQGGELPNAGLLRRIANLIPGTSTLARCIRRRTFSVLNTQRLAEHGIDVSPIQQVHALATELLVVGPAVAAARWRGLRFKHALDAGQS